MAEVDASENDSILAESGIVSDEIAETADEEQRSNQEHHGHGNLRDDQGLLKRKSLAALRRSAIAAFQGNAWIGLRGANRRPQVENRAGEKRENRGETEDAPVEAEIELDRISSRTDKPDNHATERSSKQSSQDSS